MKSLIRAVTYTLIAAVVAMSLSATWTTGLFWWTMLGCAAAGLGILTGKWIQAGREDAQDDYPAEALIVYDLCAIEFCNRYAAVQLPGSTGALLVCRYHAGWVSEWTGPAVFDQEESA